LAKEETNHMGTKPTTKTELVEFISDKARLSTLTVPALNTIWGILHRSKRPKKAGGRCVDSAPHAPINVNVDAAARPPPPTQTRALGGRVRFIEDEPSPS
jgi:hypothetical protein